MSRTKYHIAAVAILVAAFIMNLSNLAGQSPTVDEYAHVPAGYSYLVTGDFRLYSKNPPLIKMILALPLTGLGLKFPRQAWLDSGSAWGPWYFADQFARANSDQRLKIYVRARLVNLCLGFLLGLAVYLWTIELYGYGSALAATAFTAVSPTMMAHAGIATVDTGFTLFFILALYAFFRASRRSGWAPMIIAGIAFGAAMASKFTAVILIPLFLFLTALTIFIKAGNRKGTRQNTGPSIPVIAIKEAVRLGLILLIGLAAIHATYFFRKSFNSFGDTLGASRTGWCLSKFVPARISMPLPSDYIKGIDLQMLDVEQAEISSYLNGKWRRQGASYYFLEALALKEPLPGLIFIVLAAVMAAGKLKREKHRQPEQSGVRELPAWLFVHLPAAAFLFFISFFGNLQLGVRYALPVLPLAFIAASAVLREKERPECVPLTGPGKRSGSAMLLAVVLVLFFWQCLETGRAAPHYLSYFNQLAGGTRGGARYLLDSNIDWGQDLPALSKWMKKNKVEEIGLLYFGHAHPAWYGINWHLPGPADEYIAVSVNFLHGYPYALTYLAPWRRRPPAIIDPELITYRKLALILKDSDPEYVAGGSILIYKNAFPDCPLEKF